MGDEIASARDRDRDRDSRRSSSSSNVIDIHPLSGYYFSSKEAIPDKDDTLSDRILRMKSNYAATGMRTCVQGVLLVELFRHPHVLLLQVRNSFFKLPGGRLRPGESEIDGLKRKLSSKLSVSEDVIGANWQIGESLGMWWKPDFETLLYPYLPPNVQRPKECTKLFLVKLPMNQRFVVPQNLKLLAVPLCQIHGNHKTYGPIISGIPQLLSKFSFNIVEH
ncbi:pre-mRNA cleavage factor Im 25 kDa subunit 1 [Magnolia sinica]|uniref:pre-mRNA cleavage factor Im 25 kDa subunit 1 n=1 Tax=Magnolia sinica TaxID=86752 RepID=UPI00265876B5|nr:pre-mRNA cleavage factor Im 25 kDa subunit 1 [Magnolia sinica]